MRPPPPRSHDRFIQEWWDRAGRQELVVQRCRSCGVAQHYPRALCTACGKTDLTFEEASGQASLYSFTTVHRPPDPSFEAPYVVALVRLAEGPLMLTRIVEADEEDLECDDPVVLAWQSFADGRTLPVFRPASDT